MKVNNRKAAFAIVPAALALLAPALTTPAQAKMGFLHRHPMAAGVGAAVIAHHMAKHHGSAGHRNLAERHPMMTGLAAGMAAHHMAKHN